MWPFSQIGSDDDNSHDVTIEFSGRPIAEREARSDNSSLTLQQAR